MRKIFFLFLFIIILSTTAYSEILEKDKEEIQEKIQSIIELVKENNIQATHQYISPNARPELKTEINNYLENKHILTFNFFPSSFKEKENTIKVTGSYQVRGPNWSGSGAFMYFQFEKVNKSWLIKETNFHKISSPAYILKIVGIIFLIIFIIGIPLFIFWILMLVNCAKRDFPTENTKVIWLLVIILTGFIGAIIYYFVVKRKK